MIFSEDHSFQSVSHVFFPCEEVFELDFDAAFESVDSLRVLQQNDVRNILGIIKNFEEMLDVDMESILSRDHIFFVRLISYLDAVAASQEELSISMECWLDAKDRKFVQDILENYRGKLGQLGLE